MELDPLKLAIQIETVLGQTCERVITGGYSSLFSDITTFRVDPDLLKKPFHDLYHAEDVVIALSVIVAVIQVAAAYKYAIYAPPERPQHKGRVYTP